MGIVGFLGAPLNVVWNWQSHPSWACFARYGRGLFVVPGRP